MIKALISKKLKSKLQISLFNYDPIMQNLLEQLLRLYGFVRISKHQNHENFLLSSVRTDCLIIDQQHFMDYNQYLIENLVLSMNARLVIVLQNSRDFNPPHFKDLKVSILPVPVNFETGHNIHILLKKLIRSRFLIGQQ